MNEAQWGRLEAAAEAAIRQCEAWRARSLEAEAEIRRLKETLETIAGAGYPAEPEAGSLRAENAALRTRLGEARRILDTIKRRVEMIADTNE